MNKIKLSLFRPESEKDKELFKDAKSAKKKARVFFEKEDLNRPELQDFFLLEFHTTINQIYNKDRVPEPEDVKMFIRKIHTDTKLKDKDGAEFSEFNTALEQIIPRWPNRIYVENALWMEQFIQLCKQIHSFEYARDLLKSAYIDRLKKKIKSKPLIIYFDHNLFSFRDLYSDSIHINNLENRIKNSYEHLKRIADEEGWIIVGSFKDFTKKHDLLRDLDAVRISKKIKYREIFFSDFLFLNNSEFTSQDAFSGDWMNLILISPQLIRERTCISDELYSYVKTNPQSLFIRSELYKRDIKYEEFLNIVNFVLKILERRMGEAPGERNL